MIVYRPHDAVAAKGKAEPIEVWQAIEALGRVGELGGDPSMPLVGREHERALLLGAFARVRVDRSPQLVTLVGVPGIGKSRLVAELGEAVADDEEIIAWRYGRCLPYGEGVTFWALGEVVKAQCGHPRERHGRGRRARSSAGPSPTSSPRASAVGSRRACDLSSGSHPRTWACRIAARSCSPGGGCSSKGSRPGARSSS